MNRRQAARQHLVEQRTQGVEIDSRTDFIPQNLLRRHVFDTAQDLLTPGQHRLSIKADQSEAQEFDLIPLLAHQIFHPDPPMGYLLIVGAFQSGQHLIAQTQNPFHGQSLLALQHLLQRLTRHPLRGDVEISCIPAAGVNCGDMRMVESGDLFHLALSTLHPALIVDRIYGEQFQDYIPISPLVPSPVRGPRTPILRLLDQPISPEKHPYERITSCHLSFPLPSVS